MTVKELIKKLEKMPEDAKVFVYSEISEDDDFAHDVKSYTKEDIDYEDSDYGMLDYYCQGDCCAAMYLNGEVGEDELPSQTVVVIQ